LIEYSHPAVDYIYDLHGSPSRHGAQPLLSIASTAAQTGAIYQEAGDKPGFIDKVGTPGRTS